MSLTIIRVVSPSKDSSSKSRGDQVCQVSECNLSIEIEFRLILFLAIVVHVCMCVFTLLHLMIESCVESHLSVSIIGYLYLSFVCLFVSDFLVFLSLYICSPQPLK